jgi:hypothetical protein
MVIKRPALPVEGLTDVIDGIGNGGGLGALFSLPPFEHEVRIQLRINNVAISFMAVFGLSTYWKNFQFQDSRED